MYLANPTSTLTSITLTISGMTEIHDRAFFRLSGVGAVTLNNVTLSHSYIDSGESNGTFIGDSSYIEGNLGVYEFTFCEAPEIYLPSGVTAIGDYMFAYTTSLSILGNAEYIEFVGYRAFYKSGLTSLTLPVVVSILGLAFEDSSIDTLTIGGTWTYAAYNCFDEAIMMTNITIDTVDSNFNQDVETFEIVLGSSLVVYYPSNNETYLFSFPGLYTLLTEYGNAGGVVSDSGFIYKRFVSSGNEIEITGYVGTSTTLTLPETIDGFTVVGLASTVSGFENITTLRLNASFRVYKTDAFDTMISLTTFTVDSGNDLFTANNGVLYTDNGKYLLRYPINKSGTSFTVPGNNQNQAVNGIAPHAFYGCVNLTTFNSNAYVTAIGDDAFAFSSITTYQFANTSAPPRLGSYSIFNIGTMTTIRVRRNYIRIFRENPFWAEYEEYFVTY